MDEINILPKTKLNRYNLVLKCNSLEEYIQKEHSLHIEELSNKIKSFEKKNKKLTNENKKLEKDLKKSKKLYDSISSSRSWKMTKRFRK